MDILSRTPPAADHRIQYAGGVSQFGDLRIPGGKGPFPLVVFVHGGWWKSEYDLGYAGHLCGALKADGIATWNIEYRRVGEPDGGWPGTFQDVAAAADHVAVLAKQYPINLDRVMTMGHSAGGHLALWLAGRHHIPEASVLHAASWAKVPVHGVISLAGAADLRLTIDLAGWFRFAHDKQMVKDLMGGTPAEFPERYAAGSPGELLPLNVPQVLIQGTEDDQIPPELPQRYAEKARRQGDPVQVKMIQGADHFDIVDPATEAWKTVRESVKAILA